MWIMSVGITATHCNTLQHTATRCNALQHNAPHRNTLQQNSFLSVLFMAAAVHNTARMKIQKEFAQHSIQHT